MTYYVKLEMCSHLGQIFPDCNQAYRHMQVQKQMDSTNGQTRISLQPPFDNNRDKETLLSSSFYLLVHV